VVVLKLLTNLPELGNVSVVIGQENEDEELSKASIVTSGYGAAGETLGGLGVLGPTYMDYPGTCVRSLPWRTTSATSWRRGRMT